MKLKSLLILILSLLITLPIYSQNLLRGPECVVFDSLQNRYLVSNWTNGDIIAIDSTGTQSVFHSGFAHALGNCIVDKTFYVTNGPSVFGLSLDEPRDTTMQLRIEGTTQMDGMTVDNKNNLFVVASMVGKVFRINLSTQTYYEFVSGGISSRPQDIIFDEKNNRLLICSWYTNSPIQAVDLSDSSLTDLVNTPFGNCDGLAIDENGNYYVSTWGDNSVYYYDSTFTNPPTLLTGGLSGPSNICYNKRDKVIAIPNFNRNTLDLVSIPITSVEIENEIPVSFALHQNYPNPFNPETEIRYDLPNETHVTLKVYDLLGREVATLVNIIQSRGKYRVKYKPNHSASGIYFYSLHTSKFSKTMKMIYIK